MRYIRIKRGESSDQTIIDREEEHIKLALKNSQYDIIARAYNEKQLRNRYNQTRRKEEIYKKLPRIQEIERDIAAVSVKWGKELLNGRESALSCLKRELEMLAEEKRLLLLRAGYPESYLDMQYDCPDCKDTGYIGQEKCHCFKQASIDMLYTQSNLREILKTENFHTFTLKYYDNKEMNSVTGKTQMINMTEIHDICRSFAAHFGKRMENLFFYGDTGVGKTFLSHCIAKELLDHSFSVIYLSAIELFELFSRMTFTDETQEENDGMLQFIIECDLLIIDDLGTELTNTFTNSKLFYCLNTRFLHKKSTIISTNLTLERMSETYSERIFSRISSDYTLLKFFGEDIRIKKKLLKNALDEKRFQ